MAANPLPRLRKLCLALPESHEVIAWGEPTFRVRNKLFAMFAHASNHHGGGRHAVWIKSTHVTQDLLIRAQPARYFSPPYVGPGGWVGAVLDRTTDWEAVDDLLREAWLMTAPKRLAAVQPASAWSARSGESGESGQSAKSGKSGKSGQSVKSGKSEQSEVKAAGRGARTRTRSVTSRRSK